MNWLTRSALVVGLVGGATLTTTIAEAKPVEKVDVCHRERDGGWKLKPLPPAAVPAHLAHGDGLALGVVPGVLGEKFDASCAPVPFTVVNVAGPERSAEDIAGIAGALGAFTAQTGVPTNYIGSPDFGAIVEEAIDTGDRPVVIDPDTGDPVQVDILIVPQPGAVGPLADAGVAVPASAQTAATAAIGWSDDWLDYGVVDGTLYAVPNKSDLKSLIWYKESTFRDPGGTPYPVPTTFADLVALTDTMIANGQTPWCVGIESGFATGWNFTDWVEDRVLGTQTPEFYDDWVANDVGFDDPRIRDAWNDVLALWNTPGAVFEGLGTATPGVGITETFFFASVFNLAAADECLMHRQASFASFAFDPADARTFGFPADSADDSPVMGSGTFAVSLRSDVEVALVHEYFATADYADARHANQPAGFLSAVQGQDLGALGPFELSFTETLASAEVFRFDASDLMPPEIGASADPGSFWVEGTNAVIGVGQVVGPFTGKSVDDATQDIADLFCVVAPGAAC